MKADLESVDRGKYPFVIVHFHRPMYCSNNDRCTSGGGDLLRSEAEDMFNEYKVNLVITGHVHAYERTYPIYKSSATQFNYTSPSAPVYIMQGASGNREGNDGVSTSPPDWSAARSSSVGFGLLTVSKDSLSFQYYASNAEADGGPILEDSFVLTL